MENEDCFGSTIEVKYPNHQTTTTFSTTSAADKVYYSGLPVTLQTTTQTFPYRNLPPRLRHARDVAPGKTTYSPISTPPGKLVPFPNQLLRRDVCVWFSPDNFVFVIIF